MVLIIVTSGVIVIAILGESPLVLSYRAEPRHSIRCSQKYVVFLRRFHYVSPYVVTMLATQPRISELVATIQSDDGG